MAKLTIFSEREFEFLDDKTGEVVQGKMFGAFLPNGNAIEFSAPSETTFKLNEGVVDYDGALAQEVAMETRVFGGKVKFRLKKSEVDEY